MTMKAGGDCSHQRNLGLWYLNTTAKNPQALGCVRERFLQDWIPVYAEFSALGHRPREFPAKSTLEQ